jgi:hypothetical protein
MFLDIIVLLIYEYLELLLLMNRESVVDIATEGLGFESR